MGFRSSAIFAACGLLAGCSRAATTSDETYATATDGGGADLTDASEPVGSDGDGTGGTNSGGTSGASSNGGTNSGATNGAAQPDAGMKPGADAQVPADMPWQPWPEGEGPPSTVRLNHVQMIGTHNSYHIAPLIAVDASHKYTHKALDQQLAGGVRAFELDLHGGNDGKIHVYHIQAVDDRTTCSTLKDCLSTLKTWSDGHPTHTPIFVWFEVKNDTSITPAIDDLAEVEKEILDVIPAQRLITADFIKGSYASPRARVEAEGWPALRDVSGMFTFMLIDRDDLAKKYSNNNSTLDGRKIWINAASDQHTQPWAMITKVGGPDDTAEISDALKNHMMVATNVCGADKADDFCQSKLSAAVAGGLHMLKDDLPFAVSGRSYVAKLPKGSPGCNAVTSAADCDATLFE